MPIGNGDILPVVYYELLTRKTGRETVSHREEGGGVRWFPVWNLAKRRPNSPFVCLPKRGWYLGRLVPSQGRIGVRLFAVLMS